MGIPRLTSDVAPYAEIVVLGRDKSTNSSKTSDKIVVDGPSLVYHVYNALLRYTCNDSGMTSVEIPSYAAINKCLDHFLKDLTSRGVTIQKIIFDGALPLDKRPIRLERLERTRQDLEHYRKSFADGNGQRQLTGSISSVTLTSAGIPEALWNNVATVTVRQRLLPPPSFMVANAIEFLQSCEWASITHIVCGEADAFCASEAAKSGSAVLSNDSDILLYDLGDSGSVIVLRTLELGDQTHRNPQSSIRGSFFQPKVTATRLNVPSMIDLGYQRFLDSSSSTAIISQRAREQLPSDSDARWTKFRHEYRSLGPISLGHNPVIMHLHCSIAGLDPRTAELICSLKNSEVPHLYLPILLEDTDRDASWSYGYQLRRLAYSVLLHYHNKASNQKEYKHIVEFARKGQRVSNYQVAALSYTEMLQMFKVISTNVACYLDRNEVGAMATADSTATSKLFQYSLLAADMVVAERVSKSKLYEPCLSRVFVCNRTSYLMDLSFSWDDIHFYASMQSVLYSFRMLKQIIGYVIEENSQFREDELWSAAQQCCKSITDMPSIALLFPSIAVFRRSMLNYSVAEIAHSLRQLRLRVDSENVSQSDRVAQETNPPRSPLSCTGEEAHCYTEVKGSKRRKQTKPHVTGNDPSRPNTDSHRCGKQLSTNPFALLETERSR